MSARNVAEFATFSLFSKNSGSKGMSVRVLLVEDDPLIREMIAGELQDEGFDVIQAADGGEALSRVGQHVPDVLVTDVVLPGGMNGWQIAERCRQHHPRLPVVYASGFSPVEARPVPGSLSVRKPYHPAEIVEAVRQLTGQASERGSRQGVPR